MDEAAASATREDGDRNEPDRPDRGTAAPGETDRVGAFVCWDCGEAYNEEAAFLEHRHQHSREDSKEHLHIKSDTLEDTEKDCERTNFCDLCSLSFAESSELHSHMEKQHGQAPQKGSLSQANPGATKQQTYVCPECGKCYGVYGHFLNHVRAHTPAPKSKFFCDLEDLKKKPFECETCGRCYSRASALDAHRRCHEEKLIKRQYRRSRDAPATEESAVDPQDGEKHTPEKSFTCPCGKAFASQSSVRTHQRFSHNSQCSSGETQEKKRYPHKCTECQKVFQSNVALFSHKRWHYYRSEGYRQKVPCEECGKEFQTLAFLYKHQRSAHREAEDKETAAKSFLHEVCQLQKKAFECKDCGLKFSRASALQSHQLHHTDVFQEVEDVKNPLPQQKLLVSKTEVPEIPEVEVDLDNVLPADLTEADVNETDEEMDSYEPGDFNVQVISASESEDEAPQDQNPDLELLCESDQDIKVEAENPSGLISKPEMDLKIVQIDLEQAEDLRAPAGPEDHATDVKHACPDCYRWFSTSKSLSVHRNWHDIQKRRREGQPGQSASIFTCDICGHETSSHSTHCSHIEKHREHNAHTNVLYQTDGSEKKSLQCDDCGKCFSRMSALISHQMHHPKKKPFQCPDCMMTYSYASSLFNHMKNCSAQKRDDASVLTKEFNPKKTLLGPKSYHCEQCGKGFWSLGAYSHHKQSQSECADIRQRKGLTASSHSAPGHPRSILKVACPVCGRKFRHKGIMTLHMRKHENGDHKCELCDRSFRLFTSLLRHQTVHNEQPLPPPIKSFQHQVEQLKKNTYSCPDCGKLFSRAKALQFHMKSHGYETGHSPSGSTVVLEGLQCATCLAHFSNKSSLRVHQKLCVKKDVQAVVIKAESSENHTRQCQVVVDTQGDSKRGTVDREVKTEMDTGRELMIDNHTAASSLESPNTNDLKYKCQKCERSFSVIGALNLHKRIHARRSSSFTKTKLAMPVILKTPKREEQDKGSFHCSDCGRQFMSKSALSSHRKRCNSEKKYVNDNRQRTEDGTFQCNKCSKAFSNQCDLQQHQVCNPQCQTNTPSVDDVKKTPGNNSTLAHPEFSCPECDKIFLQDSFLAAHYESEHCDTPESAHLQADGSQITSSDQIPEHADVTVSGSEVFTSSVPSKRHRCPLCSMTFVKERGLRAHTWQVHSQTVKEPVSADESISACVEAKTEELSDVNNTKVFNRGTNATGGKKNVKADLPALKCTSADAVVKLEPKQEMQTPEALPAVLPPLSRLSEHTPRFLYKCRKCGKAFETEEHLDAHKTKAKSRPYCCALCCHGCWTETQLKQHLAWHDEVRCRLPIEVRYRLRAAMTSKPNIPAADRAKSLPSSPSGRPALNADSQLQSSHKCQHCGKAFLSPTALQNHEAQHGNNDTYCCSICPRTFSEIQDLIDHHQECMGDFKCSSDAPPPVTSGDTNGLTCHECGITFCHETELHQHSMEHGCVAY
ncbi:uncharacterized protein LOC143008866 isoform X1 [Genypterus blacodes]|uniref:uncharacterized protein LOC143008866 isoform X1 n=1 Tax=Genypterus blacodes TaxID=154954 RepID=UPI003F759433